MQPDAVILERLARLESDVLHLARMMVVGGKGHATVADYAHLREIAERVEGAELLPASSSEPTP